MCSFCYIYQEEILRMYLTTMLKNYLSFPYFRLSFLVEELFWAICCQITLYWGANSALLPLLGFLSVFKRRILHLAV